MTDRSLKLFFFLSWWAGVTSKFASRNGAALSSSSSHASSASMLPTPRSEDEILESANVKAFTFNELRTATRNFRSDSVLGEGGFGSVFKGWIDEKTLAPTRPGLGMVIAVKKLNQEGYQGHKEWLVSIYIHWIIVYWAKISYSFMPFLHPVWHAAAPSMCRLRWITLERCHTHIL